MYSYSYHFTIIDMLCHVHYSEICKPHADTIVYTKGV